MSIEVILKGKVMAISSLGLGSGILTQDLLDQLRKADESARVTPLTLKIANEKDMLGAYDVLDAHMTNFTDSLEALKNATLFDARSATVDGTSVAITADANSDIQEFTLDVSQLATKEIVESGKFGATTDTIADDDGSITISVGDTDYDIDYNDSMTLDDLKNAINTTAGESVNATIVKIGDDDYRLFLSSVDTGSNQDISVKDNDGNLSGTQLTNDMTTVQDGDDAKFTFNGEDITRHDNKFDDLITGYHITLKETGLSTVSVAQNRDDIMSRVDSFVEKYNAMMGEINTLTKSSTSSDERGIFSSESTLKSFQSDIRSMMDGIGGGVGTIYEYGFDIDKNGKLSVDKNVLNQKLDDNPKNVEAFFTGGEFTKDDGSTVDIEGAFSELFDEVDSYTSYNGIMDQFKDSMNDQLKSLEDAKQNAIEQLDNKYETMQKQFSAYDAMINKWNSASEMFTQLINSQNNTQK